MGAGRLHQAAPRSIFYLISILFCSERGYRIAFGRFPGRNQTADQGEDDAEGDQDQGGRGGQHCADIIGSGQMMDQGIAGDQDQQGKPDPDESGAEADDEGLRVEYLGNIPL